MLLWGGCNHNGYDSLEVLARTTNSNSVVSNLGEDLQWWCMASWHGIVWTSHVFCMHLDVTIALFSGAPKKSERSSFLIFFFFFFLSAWEQGWDIALSNLLECACRTLALITCHLRSYVPLSRSTAVEIPRPLFSNMGSQAPPQLLIAKTTIFMRAQPSENL